jgi:hypothetical protein
MAQMPRGEPRSVPDPAGDQYDEMIRQERLKRQRAEAVPAKPWASLDRAPFSRDFRLDAIYQSRPSVDSPIKIGGQTYREIDNGQANVLVPVDDLSPAEREERQRVIARAFFIADHPIGAVGYDAAILAGASSGMRDVALASGGLVDALSVGAAPRGAPIRRPTAAPQRKVAPPTRPRPDIWYRELNAQGQPMGTNSMITKSMLGTGTKANRRIRPPGWQGDGTEYNEARGHLHANHLGGSGDDPRNIVTLTHNRANTPQMRDFEQQVARNVRDGDVVDYSVTPLYGDGALPPRWILMTVNGSRSGPAARLVENPAGRRR